MAVCLVVHSVVSMGVMSADPSDIMMAGQSVAHSVVYWAARRDVLTVVSTDTC